jgi:hypothetical protein
VDYEKPHAPPYGIFLMKVWKKRHSIGYRLFLGHISTLNNIGYKDTLFLIIASFLPIKLVWFGGGRLAG